MGPSGSDKWVQVESRFPVERDSGEFWGSTWSRANPDGLGNLLG